MSRMTKWTRSWSPVLCLIFYFTAVSWLVPWDLANADPNPAANISPDIKKNVAEDLSNDELHTLLSLLAGTNTKIENPPDNILLSTASTVQTPLSTSTTTTTPKPVPFTRKSTTTTTTLAPTTRLTTSITTTTTKSPVTTTPVTSGITAAAPTTAAPKQNLRALAQPQNDLVQQLSLLNSLLGGGTVNANLGLGAAKSPTAPSDQSAAAAAEAAAALFGIGPAALLTTTTAAPLTTTTVKPLGTLDDTSQALQSLALLNVLLGNSGDSNSANNSAAAALLGLGTANSSPAVRHTQSTSGPTQQELLTNLLLQAGVQGNPQLQNFQNNPVNMDAAASNQLSGLLGLIGTLGNLGGQQQQQQASASGLFGQIQPQQQQNNLLANIFGGQQQQQQQPQAQQVNLLASLFGGAPTTPPPLRIPGLGLLSGMAALGSTIFSTVSNSLGGSRADGRPRVRGVDTRLGLGYRFGDNADAQLMWEIGPQLFTEPLKNEDRYNAGRKRQTTKGHGLIGSASNRVIQLFKAQYPQKNEDNPPWRRSDTTGGDSSIVSQESLASVASSLPHQSLKTLNALLELKKRQARATTPRTTPSPVKLSSLFSWYSSTTTPAPQKVYIPAQQELPPAPPPTSKLDSFFNWFSNPTTPASTLPPVHIPSAVMSAPVKVLDKFVSWYMGGPSEPLLTTTTEHPIHFPEPFLHPASSIPNNLNMDPSNFLRRSSALPPAPPTARSQRNFYSKAEINPRNNQHSTLTTYEKYLLGVLNEEDINKSVDMDVAPSNNNNNNNQRFTNVNLNAGSDFRPNHAYPQSNMRNPNNFPRRGMNQFGQRRRNNFVQNRRHHNVPPTQSHYNGAAHKGSLLPTQAIPMGPLPMGTIPTGPLPTGVLPMGHSPNNNPLNPSRRPGGGSQFNFGRYNNIVTMKGPRVPPGTAGPHRVNQAMRRRNGQHRPQAMKRQSSFPFNPFGLFSSKHRNRPHNNFENNGNGNGFQGEFSNQNNMYSYAGGMNANSGNGNPGLTGYNSYNPYGNLNEHNNNANFNNHNAQASNMNYNQNGHNHAVQSDFNSNPYNLQVPKSIYTNVHSTLSSKKALATNYNPHQNFVPESEDSFDRRNAVVTNAKLRVAQMEKLLLAEANRNKTVQGPVEQTERVSHHEDDSESENPANYLMGLVKNVLNTKIRPKLNNKEKNIPSSGSPTHKPILPRNRQNPVRVRTKLKLTNGEPQIVLSPQPPKEITPIVHIGDDMSFHELEQAYATEPTTKKPKTKKKPKIRRNKGEIVIPDDEDIELSEEEEGSKEVFIDIASGEVSVLKPVASLMSFEPKKEEESSEEEEEFEDEDMRRKQEIFKNIQKQLQGSYERMKKAQIKAAAKERRKNELAAKGMDESIDMVAKYFDLVEEIEKPDEKSQYPTVSSTSHISITTERTPGRNKGYKTTNSYSQLRKNRKRRRRDIFSLLMRKQ